MPKGTDLYNMKLEQYKELSVMRAECEKMLQEQRLEKLKREYERQKMDEDMNLKQQLWLEQQKMNILLGKMNEVPQTKPKERESVIEEIHKSDQ